ncbi:MAG: lipid-A-disaccharide synthase, partial [Chlamydiae bacterium]|nr:lipid-A-disaccharide synthase [Chlamydiota bacterium]
MKSSKTFFFAGELSGDKLGAPLVGKDAVGVGGPLMQEAGLTPLFDFDDFQVMGFIPVLLKLPRLLKNLHLIKRWIIKNQPKRVILIDYAEFNLLLAKKLRKAGYRGKIIQYVCPSIWAWRKGRKKILEQHVDHLLTILPFEPKLFDQLDATYVGHPDKPKVLPKKRGIALFPGSRSAEVRANLPLQLEAARKLQLPIFVSIAREKLRPLVESLAPDATAVEGLIKADGAIATCGTVTLEIARAKVPTVVTYKLSRLNYFLARSIFKIRLPYYSLANLVADRELLPEYIHRKIDPDELAQSLRKVMA